MLSRASRSEQALRRRPDDDDVTSGGRGSPKFERRRTRTRYADLTESTRSAKSGRALAAGRGVSIGAAAVDGVWSP